MTRNNTNILGTFRNCSTFSHSANSAVLQSMLVHRWTAGETYSSIISLTVVDTVSLEPSFQMSSGFSWVPSKMCTAASALSRMASMNTPGRKRMSVSRTWKETRTLAFTSHSHVRRVRRSGADLRPHQLVRGHLGEELGGLRANLRVRAVAEEVEQVDERSCGSRRVT